MFALDRYPAVAQITKKESNVEVRLARVVMVSHF